MTKTLYDQQTREELIKRINTLSENSKPLWGKMTVYQMIRHCAKWEDMLLGKTAYKQSFLGKLFGKIALKGMLKDEPLKSNMPTVPSFKMTGEGNVEEAKQDWISLLQAHSGREPEGFLHPFFGALTAEQAGRVDYKHIDHHLRQFNA